MDRTFSVGIVGTGVGIRTHAVGFQRLPGVSLAGVVGTTADRARANLESAGLSGALACTFEELIARRPDLVCLTTPPDERGQYIAPLATSGSALLVEKPLATSRERAEEIYQPLGGKAAQRVFLNVQLRGLAAFQWLRHRVASGELGEVYSIALRERAAAFRRDRVRPWQAHLRTGGGQRLAMGPHLLDLGLYLTGRAYGDAAEGRSCGATATPRGSWAGHVRPSADVADEVFSGVVAVDGCRIAMFTTAIGHGPRTLEVDIEGTEGMARFAYRDGRGSLELWGRSATERLWLVEDGGLRAGEEPGRSLCPSLFRLAFPGYAFELVRAVRDGSGGTNLASLADGVRNIAILDALAGLGGRRLDNGAEDH